jgi:acetyl-CoA acetyltransferase
MVQTAENVAREAGISREEQDALTLVRYEQYQKALHDGFHARFMVTPFEVKPDGRKVLATVKTDEGVFTTTADGLAKLRPVMDGGTVTFGSQTHPADGVAGMIVCDEGRAREWSRNGDPVQLISYGMARVAKGLMAKAVVPAARRALELARISVDDCAVIKTHNPFAVNDVFFAREMGIAPESFNDYGSSLVYGHPQAPTGARLIMEGIEQARIRGGGYVLFAGCAAGDTAAAAVLKV